MLAVGVTGGIGSGKSTFAALLFEHGARLIDADEMGRAALAPGEPAWHSVVDQFGREVLEESSLAIDRHRLAAIVFNDPSQLAALNAIVHPVIWGGIADELEQVSAGDDVVVIDAALIVDSPLEEACDSLVVVHAPVEVRLRRVMQARGMTEAEARARMASQTDPDELLAHADIVVNNNGSLEDLAAEAERVWKELETRREA